jgi:VWFA-related protein
MRRPGLVRVVGWLALLGAASSGKAQAPTGPITPAPGTPVQQAPPESRIVTQVSLVNTPVTVRDSKGQMIANLEEKDFHVTDNGVAQKISHFDLGGDPLSLVILVETSGRIAPLFAEVQKTGIVLTEQVMGPEGEAAVIGFNDSVDKLLDFTKNHDAVEKTINKLKNGTNGLKLYDAMAVGVEMLSGRPLPSAAAPGRRRVMLILSEATDVGSETGLGAVLRRAQLTNVTIYSVGLSTTAAQLKTPPKEVGHQSHPPGTFPQPPLPGTIQTPTTEATRYGSGDLMQAVIWAVQHVKDTVKANPLEMATAGTGGAHLAAFKDRSIEKAIDEIGGELHSQYSVSYTPVGVNGSGFHEIKVTVERKDLRVRARPGYYLAPPGS